MKRRLIMLKKTVTQPGFAGTKPQEVKQEIKEDVLAGNGDKTSREYGHMNHKRK
jgi:hypothetical protein